MENVDAPTFKVIFYLFSNYNISGTFAGVRMAPVRMTLEIVGAAVRATKLDFAFYLRLIRDKNR
jgi:hypothetical protein